MTDKSSRPASGSGLPSGTRLNGIYEIEEPIAEGGMGEVYRAHNIQTHDLVAIKLVLPEHARNEDALALFRREASMLHNLYHEAIVRYYVFTVDPDLGRAYLAMEYVDGPSLSDVLRRGPLPLEAVRHLQRRLASGLEAAHRRGVVHRDLSPDNVILPEGDVRQAKIIDFGIARSTRPGDGTIIGGGFAGKYNYVSPEQLGLYNHEIDAKSDIYSLGLLLAGAMLGRPLNMDGTQFEVIEKRRTVPDLTGIDPSMLPLITAMLQPNPDHRPASMDEVARWGEERTTPAWEAAPRPVDMAAQPPGHSRRPDLSGGYSPPVAAPTPVVGGRDDAASRSGQARADQARPARAAVRPPPKRSRAGLMAGVAAAAVMIAVVGGAAVFLADRFGGGEVIEPIVPTLPPVATAEPTSPTPTQPPPLVDVATPDPAPPVDAPPLPPIDPAPSLAETPPVADPPVAVTSPDVPVGPTQDPDVPTQMNSQQIVQTLIDSIPKRPSPSSGSPSTSTAPDPAPADPAPAPAPVPPIADTQPPPAETPLRVETPAEDIRPTPDAPSQSADEIRRQLLAALGQPGETEPDPPPAAPADAAAPSPTPADPIPERVDITPSPTAPVTATAPAEPSRPEPTQPEAQLPEPEPPRPEPSGSAIAPTTAQPPPLPPPPSLVPESEVAGDARPPPLPPPLSPAPEPVATPLGANDGPAAGSAVDEPAAGEEVEIALLPPEPGVASPPANRPPQYPSSSVTPVDAELGRSYVATLPSFRDPDGDSISVTVEGDLPPGLSVFWKPDGAVQVSGIPTIGGSYPFTIVGRDPNGGETRIGVTVNVLSSGDSPIRILPPGSPTDVAVFEPVPEPQPELPEPAIPEPTVPSDRTIYSYLETFDGGPCFFARPLVADLETPHIEGFGATIEGFQRLESTFMRDYQTEPRIDVRMVEAGQCPAVDFMHQIGLRRASEPLIDLETFTVGADRPLAGRIGGLSSGALTVLLVGNDGSVTRLDRLLTPSGDGASFSIPMQADGESRGVPQLLMAIVTDRPLSTLPNSGEAREVFTALTAEVRQGGIAVGLDAEMFKID